MDEQDELAEDDNYMTSAFSAWIPNRGTSELSLRGTSGFQGWRLQIVRLKLLEY